MGFCFDRAAGGPSLTTPPQWATPSPHEFIFAGSSRNPKLGQPKPFDVDDCVNVSIQYGTTALARPVTLLQCEVWVVRSTRTASLAERRPPVDFYDGSVGVTGHPLKDGYELRECKVAALSPPQAFHPIEVGCPLCK